MTARVYNSLHSAGFMVISRFILVLQHNQFSFFNITALNFIFSFYNLSFSRPSLTRLLNYFGPSGLEV